MLKIQGFVTRGSARILMIYIGHYDSGYVSVASFRADGLGVSSLCCCKPKA